MSSRILIKSIRARMIINSRGEPTVEVLLRTNLDDRVYRASAPSGASRGEHEAWEIRDRGVDFGGLGVSQAVSHVNQIIGPALKGRSVLSQSRIDQALVELDGHRNKSRLGANAILPVSIAVCRAAAAATNQPLWRYLNGVYQSLRDASQPKMPKPCFNVINGGAHAGGWLDFQEFMIVPQGRTFYDNFKMGAEIYGQLRGLLLAEVGPSSINIGDEGGFVPAIVIPESALDLIIRAVNRAPNQTSVKIGLDCAANSFFDQGQYRLAGSLKTRESLMSYYQELVSHYPIAFIEDPLEENDWLGWAQLNQELNGQASLIGDDLIVTNVERVKKAEEAEAVDGIVVKPNQIGTVYETLEAAALAASYNWQLMVSHRSGDTNDDFIADLAVAIGSNYIKSGAPARGERLAKYNRLLEIESELKDE